jgi:cytochrome b6-f complex iron-sulfur subunit
MNRREFISWVGIGGLASSLPVAIAACSSSAPPSAAPGQGSGQFKPAGDVSTLDTAGFLATQVEGQDVIVIRDPAQPGQVLALNPTCTHKGCKVNWDASKKGFGCPCHGAQYGTNGKVLKGPADKDLKVYSAKIEGPVVQVKV